MQLHRSNALSVLATLAVIGLPGLAACPDTAGEFDEFLDKSEPYRVVLAARECSAAVDLSGSYVMGASVVVDPLKPLRFKLDLVVSLEDATITADLQVMAVPPNNDTTPPGTLVGAVNHTTADLDLDDGSFVLDFGSIDVPKEANAILAAPVTAHLVLEGCTAAPTAACGVITGDLTSPVALPLLGSTWAIAPLPAGTDPYLVPLTSACPTE